MKGMFLILIVGFMAPALANTSMETSVLFEKACGGKTSCEIKHYGHSGGEKKRQQWTKLQLFRKDGICKLKFTGDMRTNHESTIAFYGAGYRIYDKDYNEILKYDITGKLYPRDVFKGYKQKSYNTGTAKLLACSEMDKFHAVMLVSVDFGGESYADDVILGALKEVTLGVLD
ncbi:hypothetical protein [Microbulbifer mangrovi]|uniref:hypothetical protein n=1 Tax=Microbulbifer mangrovi TaxID=927787 RepID=UPI000990538B|nr:hypothetical protein [Microbulbifer mangrovi]